MVLDFAIDLQIGFGALFGYAVFVGLFKVKQKAPVRKA